MFKKIVYPALVLSLFLGILFLGCSLNGDDPFYLNLPGDIGPFVGNWFSGSDGYEISNTVLFYDDGSNGTWGMSFAGAIRHVSSFDVSSGVIIVEYTSTPTMPYTVSNNFLGIYYKILAPDMIKFANSYGPSTNTPDLNSAIATFTQMDEATFVYSWTGVAAQFRQVKPALNLGDLEGTWLDTGDYGYVNYIDVAYATYTDKIDSNADGWGFADIDADTSDDLIQFSGVIQETTDTSQTGGIIYIRLTNVEYLLNANIGEYYAIKWQSKSGSGGGSTLEFAGADGYPQSSLVLAKSYLTSFGSLGFVEYAKQ